MPKKVEIFGGVKPKRGHNRTWTVYADGKLIGIVEELRETKEVIGLYVAKGENRLTKCGPFDGKTIGERTSIAAGYMIGKVDA